MIHYWSGIEGSIPGLWTLFSPNKWRKCKGMTLSLAVQKLNRITRSVCKWEVHTLWSGQFLYHPVCSNAKQYKLHRSCNLKTCWIWFRFSSFLTSSLCKVCFTARNTCSKTGISLNLLCNHTIWLLRATAVDCKFLPLEKFDHLSILNTCTTPLKKRWNSPSSAAGLF